MICKLCLNTPSHPFGVSFDERGVCSGCITAKEYANFSPKNLLKLIKAIKKSGKRETYDCVVPIRGDADDYFVISTLLEYDVRPLLIGVNSYFLNDIGWKNIQTLQTCFDLDTIFYNPNFSVYQSLVSYSLSKFADINLPFQFIFHSFVKIIAIAKNIKYIIYGENQPTEQTGNFSNFDFPEKSLWFHTVFDFRDKSLEDFLGTGAEYNLKDLFFYNYPNQNKKYPIGVFLSNFIIWNSMDNNSKILKFGFTPQKQRRTYDYFHRAGYSHYYEMVDYLRYKNCGYLKVRDHLNRDIRLGILSRKKSLEVYEEYKTVPFDFNPFFDWVNANQSARKWLMEHTLKYKQKEYLNKELSVEYMGQYCKVYKEPIKHFVKFSKELEIGDIR